MFRLLALVSATTFGLTLLGMAQDEKKKDPNAVVGAASKVVAVTVYQNTALVTREVVVPEKVGLNEIIVTPLPADIMQSSIYSEGDDGLRILSTRYRERAIAKDNRDEVQALQAEIEAQQKKIEMLQAELQALTSNMELLTKLESFTGATLSSLTDKGQLDAEKTIALTDYIREARTAAAKEKVTLEQQIAEVQKESSFSTRKLNEISGGIRRTERDAIIVVDKQKVGPMTLRLNYLVSSASWKPTYKLRAGTEENDKVALEYLASVTQQTGEDWTNVALTLSTAQPLLNASPPDLLALEVTATGSGFGGGGFGGQGGFGGGFGGNAFGGESQLNAPALGVPGEKKEQSSSMPNRSAYLKDLSKQSQNLRQQAQDNFNSKNPDIGNTQANSAAALDQYRDLILSDAELRQSELDGIPNEGGPSVTYRLKTNVSLPSRSDGQVIEIAKFEIAPTFYYKAVPVLNAQVYRIADMVNDTKSILLPGEATMYIGSDFVGQTTLPLVAVGKKFTVGFGADPQLSVMRKLISKEQTTQGGNAVRTFTYQILLNSYKTVAVDVQVMDRMPHSSQQQSIAIDLTSTTPDLSENKLYLRDERPKNLLRWDVKLLSEENGDKALTIDYEYKIEFDRNVTISAFQAK